MGIDPAAEDLLPVVPLSRRRGARGRPFNTTTPLGQMMKARGLRVSDTAALAGMSERKLTEILSGRKLLKPLDALYLSRALNCQPSEITGSSGPRPLP